MNIELLKCEVSPAIRAGYSKKQWSGYLEGHISIRVDGVKYQSFNYICADSKDDWPHIIEDAIERLIMDATRETRKMWAENYLLNLTEVAEHYNEKV